MSIILSSMNKWHNFFQWTLAQMAFPSPIRIEWNVKLCSRPTESMFTNQKTEKKKSSVITKPVASTILGNSNSIRSLNYY